MAKTKKQAELAQEVTKQDALKVKRFVVQAGKTHGFGLAQKGMKVIQAVITDSGVTHGKVETEDGRQWIAWVEGGETKFEEFFPFGEVKKPETALTVPEPVEVEVVDDAAAKEAVEYIEAELTKVSASFCRIGFKLWEVSEKKLYLAFGYKNVYEFGEKLFGLKRASVNNNILVCERFSEHTVDGLPSSLLAPLYNRFNFSQLSEVMRLPEDKAELATPEMTCKEIRALKEAEAEPVEECGAPDTWTETITLFCRELTKDNLLILIKLLRENIGRVVTVEAEYTMANDGETQPA